jgi:hypothetical protein
MTAFRGTEQIRTAVKGFADLCLAPRPRYLIKKVQRVNIIRIKNSEH